MGNLYEHIEQLAKSRGFKNITELCRAAGVPRATMTELKMGRSKDISKANAQKLARALGISLDAVYDIGNKEKAPAGDGKRSVSDDELKFALWGDCQDVSDDDLADVLRYAAFVRERKKDQK